MLRRELLASGHSALKGKSHLCQVCLKFILTPAHRYLRDGQHQRKVPLVINFCLTRGTEMKGGPFLPGAAFVFQGDQSSPSPVPSGEGQVQHPERWGNFGVSSHRGTPQPAGPRAPSPAASQPPPIWGSAQPHTMQRPGNGLESKLCGIFVMAVTFVEKAVTSCSFCRLCNPSQPATASLVNFYSFGSIRQRYSREQSFLMDLSY